MSAFTNPGVLGALAQQSAPAFSPFPYGAPTTSEPSGPLGWVSKILSVPTNFAKDIGAMAQGLGHLVVGGASELFTLGTADTDFPEIMGGNFPGENLMTGFATDIYERYIKDFPGGLINNALEHPGFLAADVFGLSGGVGAIARGATGLRTGGALSKAASLVRPVETSAAALRAARDAGMLEAGTVARLAADAGVRVSKPLIPSLQEGVMALRKPGQIEADVLRQLDTMGSADDFRARLDQQLAQNTQYQDALAASRTVGATARLANRLTLQPSSFSMLNPDSFPIDAGPERYIVQTFSHHNPLTRMIVQKGYGKYASTPLANLEQDFATLAARVDEGDTLMPWEKQRYTDLQRAISTARSYGVRTVEKPGLSNIRAKRLANFIASRIIGQHSRDRDELIGRFNESMDRIPEELLKMEIGEGTDDANLYLLNAVDEATVLGRAGFGDASQAVDALYNQSHPLRNNLTPEIMMHLAAKLKRGDIVPPGGGIYSPTVPELLESPERVAFVEQWKGIWDRVGVPAPLQSLGLMPYDAAAMAAVRTGRYGTVGEFFDALKPKLEETWAKHIDNTLYQVQRGLLDRPDLADRLIGWATADEAKGRRAAQWYPRSTRGIEMALRGVPDIVIGPNGRRVTASHLLYSIIAATSFQNQPSGNMTTALKILENHLKYGPETAIAGAADLLGEFDVPGDQLNKVLTGENVTSAGMKQTNQAVLRRILIDGETMDEWFKSPENMALVAQYPKVARFQENLRGNLNELTLDRRMNYMFGISSAVDLDRAMRADGTLLKIGSREYRAALEAGDLLYEGATMRDVVTQIVDDFIAKVDERFGGTFKLTRADAQAVLWVSFEDIMRNEAETLERLAGKSKSAKANAIREDAAWLRNMFAEEAKKGLDSLDFWDTLDPDFGTKAQRKLAQQRLDRVEGIRELAEKQGGAPPDTRTMNRRLNELRKRMATKLGFELFQQMEARALGSITFGDPFNIVLRFAKDANFSTMIHEGGHLLRRTLDDDLAIGANEAFDVVDDLPEFDPIDATPEEYVAARELMPDEYKPFVTRYTPEQIREGGFRVIMAPDKKTGMLLKPDGELAGLFSVPGAARGSGKRLLFHAIDQIKQVSDQPIRFEYFTGYLDKLYESFGVTPSERFGFDEAILRGDYGDLPEEVLRPIIDAQPEYVVGYLPEGIDGRTAEANYWVRRERAVRVRDDGTLDPLYRKALDESRGKGVREPAVRRADDQDAGEGQRDRDAGADAEPSFDTGDVVTGSTLGRYPKRVTGRIVGTSRLEDGRIRYELVVPDSPQHEYILDPARADLDVELEQKLPPDRKDPVPEGYRTVGWTVDKEERFARAFEQYIFNHISEGEAHSAAFKELRQTVAGMWNDMKNYYLANDLIPPNLASAMDQYFADVFRGMNPEPAAFRAPQNVPLRWERPLDVPNLSTGNPVVSPFKTVDEAFDAAARAERPLRRMLEELFPRSVKTRVKPLNRALEVAEITGAVPTDMLGARIIVGDWKEAETVLQKLGQSAVAIIDKRQVADATGRRSLTVVLDVEGMPVEVQIGTNKFDRTDAATSTMAHDLQDRAVSIAEMQKRLQEGINPQTGQPYSPEQVEQIQAYIVRQEQEIKLGNYYLQTLWEPVTDELAKNLLDERIPGGSGREGWEDLRLTVHTELTDPLIKLLGNKFSPASVFERTYLPLRIKSGAKWEIIDTDGNPIGDFVGGLSAEELHLQRMRDHKMAPIYVPHIDVRRMRWSDMLTAHTAIGARKAAQPKYTLRNTGELMLSDYAETDLRKAYSTRAGRALRWRDTLAITQEFTDRFARKIEDVTDINPETERLFAPDGMLAFFNAKIGVNDSILAEIADSLDMDPAQMLASEGFANVMGKLQKQVISVTKRGVPLYAMNRHAVEQFERLFRISGWETPVRMFWDQPMKVWRSLVLTGSPRWILNNVIGNQLFLKMQGGRLTDVIRQLDPKFRAMVNELFPDDNLRREVQTNFTQVETQHVMHLGSASTNPVGAAEMAIAEKWKKSRWTALPRKYGEWIKLINGAVEDAYRNAGFITALERQTGQRLTRDVARRFWISKGKLEKMATDGITPAQAAAALDEVNYFFNDYTRLGHIERQVIRRYVAPFYSFYKHTAKLALTYPMNYAGRAAVFRAMSDLANDMEREGGPRPEFLGGALSLFPGSEPGSMLFTTATGPNPFSGLVQSPLGLLAPPWKVGIEHFTGRSLFTGRAFTDPNVIYPYGSEQGFRVVKDSDGKIVNMVPVEGAVAPGFVEHLLQQVPQYNILRNLAAGGRTYDTTTLANALLGGGPKVDATGQTIAPYTGLDALGQFVGVPLFEYNLNNYQARFYELQQQALNAYLKQGQVSTAPTGVGV